MLVITCNWLLVEGPYYSYELSVCLRGLWERVKVLGQSGVQGSGTRGLGSRVRGLENVVLVRNFQIKLLAEEIWSKNCIFEDNIGLWFSKCLKNAPFCLGILKI